MIKRRVEFIPMSVSTIQKRLKELSSKKKATLLQGFFKTGKGEYGEGDVFIGVTVPNIRKVAGEYKDIELYELSKLLKSAVHEERLTALLILVSRFKSAKEQERNKIYAFYLKHAAFINNWDLVDLSAHHIIGAYLKDKKKDILYQLALSNNLWERRMAIIATFYDIRESKFKDALRIADMFLGDKEDLIHKAAGWMLREVGKRDLRALHRFLQKRYQRMPRTMLRYAIERLPEARRQAYLKK